MENEISPAALEEARKIEWTTEDLDTDDPEVHSITNVCEELQHAIARALEAARREGHIAGLREAAEFGRGFHPAVSPWVVSQYLETRAAELEAYGTE